MMIRGNMRNEDAGMEKAELDQVFDAACRARSDQEKLMLLMERYRKPLCDDLKWIGHTWADAEDAVAEALKQFWERLIRGTLIKPFRSWRAMLYWWAFHHVNWRKRRPRLQIPFTELMTKSQSETENEYEIADFRGDGYAFVDVEDEVRVLILRAEKLWTRGEASAFRTWFDSLAAPAAMDRAGSFSDSFRQLLHRAITKLRNVA